MPESLKRNPVAQAVLAALIVIGFFVAMFLPGLVPGFEVDEALKQTLVTMFILVIGFYFGSSSSSQAKDNVIAQQATAAAQETNLPTTVKIDDTKPVAVKEVST